jgi:hypothetical protein
MLPFTLESNCRREETRKENRGDALKTSTEKCFRELPRESLTDSQPLHDSALQLLSLKSC